MLVAIVAGIAVAILVDPDSPIYPAFIFGFLALLLFVRQDKGERG